MAGLIFFWQGQSCVHYDPVLPGFPHAGYSPVKPLPAVVFLDKWNSDISSYVDKQPPAGVSYQPKSGSAATYAPRLPPSCKHD